MFWPHWSRPLWLLLLPLLIWLLWKLWQPHRQEGGWRKIIPKAFQPWLLSSSIRNRRHFPLMALALGWLLALTALLGPSWRYLETPAHLQTEPLVILLQMTPSIQADDLRPNRLEYIRHKLKDLLDQRQQALTALVVYAGSAHVAVPLSDDRNTTLNLLQAITPTIMPVAGQRADLAVQQGLQLLDQTAQGGGRLLLIASGLTATEEQAIGLLLKKSRTPISILGLGTLQGAPVIGLDGRYLENAQGAIDLPRLDEAALKAFAARHDAIYQRILADDQDLIKLELFDVEKRPGRPSGDADRQWVDQGHWLLLPILLLAACASRRGWLFLLPLCLLWTPPNALAAEFESLWRRPDQRGMHLLQQGQAALAAERFEDFRWQGWAHYQAGNYAAAAKAFAQGDRAEDHYNRGNALVGLGRYGEASVAFRDALQRDPSLTAARENLSRLETWLMENYRITANLPHRETNAAKPFPESNDSHTELTQRHIDPQTKAQWLHMIPDDPSELLRRKFWYQQQMQETEP